MKYSLVITQTAEGETFVTAADADGTVNGGALVLNYFYDGAEYRLEISRSEMVQTREGDVRLYMRFRQGQTTAARLYEGRCGGEFPVSTRKLLVQFDGADCKASCEFSYGACGAVTSLSVVANVLQ